MARELSILITADGRQAREEMRAVDRAQAQLEANTRKLASAQTGLVDAYGRAIKPTQDLAAAQETVNTKKKAAASITDQLSGALLRYISGAVLLAAIDRTIKYASGLDKMALSLGTTVRGIQELENIAASSNTTVEAMSNAIFQMQIRIEGNDKSAVAAFKKLGISILEWKAMRPEEQFFTVARALREVGDTAAQNRLGTDIMGKSFREVSGAMRGDIDKLKESVAIMSDTSIQDLNKTENAWNRLWLAAKRYFGEFIAWNAATFTTELPKAVDAVGQSTGLSRVLGDMAEPFRYATPSVAPAPGLPIAPGPTAPDPAVGMRVAAAQLARDRAAEEHRQLIAGIRQQDAASTINLRYSPSAWQAWMATQQKGFEEGPLGSMGDIPGLFAGRAAGEGFGANSLLIGRTIGNGLGMGPADIGNGNVAGRLSFFGRSGISGDALTQIGMQAATGGGNLGQSAGGLLAGGLTKSLMTNSAGQMIGGALGSFLPGIGTILGTLAGGALGKLFGPSEESLKVNKPREEFFDKMGGLDALHGKLQLSAGGVGGAQGLTGALFNAKTEKDMKAAIEAISSSLDTYIAKLKEGESALAALTLTTQHVTDVTPEMQAALDSALNAKNIDDYNAGMSVFAGLVDEQITKQKELDETLKKYGISWTETGERAKMAKLAEIASGLGKEFEILRGAGVDVNVVMRSMGPHVNQFVKDAQKAGVEVPESFKKVIQTAIDAGEIFDANGAAVKDITTLGLTFGSTMESVQREMVDAMKELARVLKEDLGGAFANVRSTADAEFKRIPRELDIKVNYESEGYDVGERSHSGSIIRPWGLERFHNGGLLHDERLIIAQTGEAILNRRAVANMGAGAVHALNRGEKMGGATVIQDPELKAEIRSMNAAFTRFLRQFPEQVAAAQMGPRPRR